jgi:hypothetical protein
MAIPFVGTINFDYIKEPYTYVNALNNEITQYKQVAPVVASGTNDIIGSVFINTETQKLANGSISGQITETFNLPQGSFQVTFIGTNFTQTGGFFPNTVYKANITSGSGDFLGSCGILNANTDSTKIRKINVTFYNSWKYPFGA